MSVDSQWETQQAVLTTLRGASGLTALLASGLSSIVDHAAADTLYPYVLIGEATARPGEADSKDSDAFEQTLTIHTWSQYRGLKEVKQIMAQIVSALDQASLTVTGHNLIQAQFEFSETFLDPDGLTRHGVQRFRVTTQVTA